MWRSRIFWRLFGAISVLLVVSLGLLGWVLISRIETHLLQEARRSLEKKALLVCELVNRQQAAEWQEQMGKLARETHNRITLIAADGTVLADSSERPDHMENHAGRAEVHEAKHQGVGAATRYSDTLRESMIYVARRNDDGAVRYVRLARSLRTTLEEIAWLRQVTWTAAALTLVLALALSWVLARRASAPLVELATAARSIAQGSHGQRVAISSRDEIGTLATAFNEMSQACAAHIAQMDRDRQQLRAIFRSMVEGVLVLDAEQRIQFLNEAAARMLQLTPDAAQGRKLWQVLRHRQLAEAVHKVLGPDETCRCDLEWQGHERKVLAVHGTRLPGEPLRGAVLVLHDVTHLRQLERVRQDFVANVSHELKTPLAAIQATVETLQNGALQDPDHNVRFVERIRENTERLSSLVQDLLTLGRIEAGQETMELEPMSLQTAVETCLARHADRAVAKALHLEASPPGEDVTVLADEEALAVILDNLVDNAIKYTHANGWITVRWSRQGEEAVLQVQDTGVGIPTKDLPRVFERFFRVDRARSRQLGGTGLGLSIVKHLVQALGGSISASSQAGVGSTFIVRLPLFPESPAMGALERKRLVFVCVENSNRSQMAEAFARIHGAGRVEVFSAGSRPSGRLNPRAVESMREIGYDLSQHRSKGLDGLPPGPCDVAVTMGCGDQCPNLRARQREDWSIPDPRDMPAEQFRSIRDLIEEKVKDLLGRLAAKTDAAAKFN